MKKARPNGCKKKRSKQILFSGDEVLTEPVTAVEVHTALVLGAQELTEPVLEVMVQTGPVLDVLLLT
jgi:hypothetical protein